MDLESSTSLFTARQTRSSRHFRSRSGVVSASGITTGGNTNRLVEGDSVLSDVKSLYDVVIDNKRTTGNPKEPVIDRLLVAGELMEQYQRPDLRQKAGSIFERLGREVSTSLRSRGYDPLTGLALIYPTQVLLAVESNSDAIRKLLKKFKERESNPERIVVQYHTLHVAIDVTRQMRAFTTKMLNQPLPLPNWSPPGGLMENAAEILLIRILRQIQEMSSFIQKNGKEKRIMDLVVEKKPESIPDQDSLLYVCRSGTVMTTTEYLAKYASPSNLSLANDQTWPTNWAGKRLACSVTIRDDSPDESWGVDLGIGTSSSHGQLACVISKVGIGASS